MIASSNGISNQNKGAAICYFLVCYSDVEHVSFLLASLYTMKDIFLVHCDPKAPDSLKNYLQNAIKKYPNIIIIPEVEYSWAGYSHVDATLRGMKEAFIIDNEWQHFVVLSEQHLPLKSPEEIALLLERDGTRLNVRRCIDMAGIEQSDIHNRFGAIYRELPGVGCFAIKRALRVEGFFASIFHGSNWFSLSRAHCRRVLECERAGDLDLYKSTVHAEETAIQSILGEDLINHCKTDATLVAEPHITDNHSLVMTDSLFFSALKSDHLFIRKRQRDLSKSVSDFVKKQHFSMSLFQKRETSASASKRICTSPTAKYIGSLAKHLSQFCEALQINIINCENPNIKPAFHVMITCGKMLEKHSVRILSENGIDFKVLIAKEQPFGPFEQCHDSGTFLYSTLRVRAYGLFGYQEILPTSISSKGFVSISEPFKYQLLTQEILRFLGEAVQMR